MDVHNKPQGATSRETLRGAKREMNDRVLRERLCGAFCTPSHPSIASCSRFTTTRPFL